MQISINKSTIYVSFEHECAKPFQLFVCSNIIVTNAIAKGKINEEFRCTIHQFMRVLNISQGVLLKSIGAVTISRPYSGTISICFISNLKLHEEKVHVCFEVNCSECDKQFKNENHLQLHEKKVHV